MQRFEAGLFDNKTLMAEKYRTWAAKAVDGKYWDTAKKLLDKSFSLNKTNLSYYKTLSYYFRSKRKENNFNNQQAIPIYI